MAGQGAQRSQHGVDAGLHVTFAAAQGREPESDERVLELAEVVATEREIGSTTQQNDPSCEPPALRASGETPTSVRGVARR